jgi:hypothetical protein
MANEFLDETVPAARVGAAENTQRSQPKLSVLFLGLAAILTFFGAVGLVLYLKPGGDVPAPGIFVAGPLEGFEPGSVTYFESEHVFVVRLNDGGLIALYDLGPKGQYWVSQGETEKAHCRAKLGDLPSGIRERPDLSLPAGFEKTGFNQLCDGGWWDAEGRGLSGPLNGDLDRFPVSVVDGIVHVDVANRLCLNPVSEAAPCSPTR